MTKKLSQIIRATQRDNRLTLIIRLNTPRFTFSTRTVVYCPALRYYREYNYSTYNGTMAVKFERSTVPQVRNFSGDL